MTTWPWKCRQQWVTDLQQYVTVQTPTRSCTCLIYIYTKYMSFWRTALWFADYRGPLWRVGQNTHVRHGASQRGPNKGVILSLPFNYKIRTPIMPLYPSKVTQDEVLKRAVRLSPRQQMCKRLFEAVINCWSTELIDWLRKKTDGLTSLESILASSLALRIRFTIHLSASSGVMFSLSASMLLRKQRHGAVTSL